MQSMLLIAIHKSIEPIGHEIAITRKLIGPPMTYYRPVQCRENKTSAY